MVAVSLNKRDDIVGKVLALVCGILLGCLYASFGRSATKTWFRYSKTFEATTIETTTEKMVINETAQFLVPDDTSLADNLAQKIRVLCWVHNDNPENKRMDAIRRTWGNRCTKLIFIKKVGPNSTDVFNIPNDENSSSNIENAYRFLYEEYLSEFDWFLKTTASSYVVMENLRYKLFAYNSSDAVGMGLALKNTEHNQVFFSERAGYVLSRKALELLLDAFEEGPKCMEAKMKYPNPLRIGMCLGEMKVNFAESNDSYGKQQFFDKHLDEYFLPNPNVSFPYPWYEDYKVDQYLDHASNYSISFCDISDQHMFVLEYLIYQLRPYGLETETPLLPELIHY